MYSNYEYFGRQVVKQNICVLICGIVGIVFGLQLVEYDISCIIMC
jgi:hypothetical protein